MAVHAIVSLVVFAPLCAGHGAMNMPPTWQDRDGAWTYAGGTSGAGCTGAASPASQGCVMQWYSNYTFIPGEPTIPAQSPLLTYMDACQDGKGISVCCTTMCQQPGMQAKGKPCAGCDWTRTHPWRAPGTAPVFSPCGIDGGNPKGCPAGNPSQDGCPLGGYGHGPDGRTLEGNTKPQIWSAGGEAETSWGLTANHGGGYQFRLCPKPKNSSDLTEECFQKMPLPFIGDTQWLQKDKYVSTRVAIPALRTVVGTFPAGSQWTRNPIPACGGFTGGFDGICNGTQFPPPVPGATAFFESPWNIIDIVQVPNVTGDFVISFRYDCEQTTQVWQQCGDVRIVRGSAPTPGPAPAPGPSSSCPGGSFAACISLCPSDPAEFKACMNECRRRCDEPPAPAPPVPTPPPSPAKCDACVSGVCKACLPCVNLPNTTKVCAPCWAKSPINGTACLPDCKPCWGQGHVLV